MPETETDILITQILNISEMRTAGVYTVADIQHLKLHLGVYTPPHF